MGEGAKSGKRSKSKVLIDFDIQHGNEQLFFMEIHLTLISSTYYVGLEQYVIVLDLPGLLTYLNC